jgi:Tol biopolymer transport system component
VTSLFLTGSSVPFRVAVVAGLVLIGSATLARGGSVPERRGVIAFEAEAGLYVIRADGGKPGRIPGSLPGDGNPVFSPDGSQLSFDRERNGSWDVYVMDADGSDQRQLTFSRADDDFARWAPHGRSLAFQSERRRGRKAVYVISLRTGVARRVTASGAFPDWTPDGKIIFTKNDELWSVRPYGRDEQPLPTKPPGNVLAARVSKDGKKIVLVYPRGGRDGIVTTRIDGSGAKKITGESQDTDPVWSPDGNWVAFDKLDSRDVYVVREDGSQETRLTSLGTACCPDWSNTATAPQP